MRTAKIDHPILLISLSSEGGWETLFSPSPCHGRQEDEYLSSTGCDELLGPLGVDKRQNFWQKLNITFTAAPKQYNMAFRILNKDCLFGFLFVFVPNLLKLVCLFVYLFVCLFVRFCPKPFWNWLPRKAHEKLEDRRRRIEHVKLVVYPIAFEDRG